MDNFQKQKTKTKKNFFADISLDSREGIGLKQSFTSSVWHHTQISDQLHDLSDLNYSTQSRPQLAYDSARYHEPTAMWWQEAIQSFVKN